jgi:hypothetical protein
MDRLAMIDSKIALAAQAGRLTADQAAAMKKQADALAAAMTASLAAGAQRSDEQQRQVQILGKTLNQELNPNAPAEGATVAGATADRLDAGPFTPWSHGAPGTAAAAEAVSPAGQIDVSI